MIYIIIPTTKERRDRLEKCIESIRNSDCPYDFTICTFENKEGGWAIALSKMIEGINGLVFLVGDDMVLDKDCIRILYEKYIENFPELDGLAQPFENYGHGNTGDSPFLHTDTLRPFLNLGYIHYVDNEIATVMHARKKYLVVPEAKITHEHFSEFPDLMDETYKISQSVKNQDFNLFNERKKNLI